MKYLIVVIFLLALTMGQFVAQSQETTAETTPETVEETEPAAVGETTEEDIAEDEATAEDVVDLDGGTGTSKEETAEAQVEKEEAPMQAGPFIDLFGPTLYSLEMVDETSARINEVYTNEALAGKSVVGLYFSADW